MLVLTPSPNRSFVAGGLTIVIHRRRRASPTPTRLLSSPGNLLRSLPPPAPLAVGWSTRGNPSANAGFGNVPDPTFDATYGGAPEGASFKTKVVNLISAVRTLMRCECGVVQANAPEDFYFLSLGKRAAGSADHSPKG